SPIDVSNALAWTLYPRTYLVTNTSPDDVDGSLRRALIHAARDPSGSALVTFWRDAFPGHGAPQTIALGDRRCALPSDDPDLCCEPDSHHAALCFRGSGVVVDGLDGDAEPGGVVLSAANGMALLRVYHRDNVFRGLVFHGSQADISANPCADDEDSRSEEHTSELQSLTNLVCRLLLEKKKQNADKRSTTRQYKQHLGDTTMSDTTQYNPHMYLPVDDTTRRAGAKPILRRLISPSSTDD